MFFLFPSFPFSHLRERLRGFSSFACYFFFLIASQTLNSSHDDSLSRASLERKEHILSRSSFEIFSLRTRPSPILHGSFIGNRVDLRTENESTTVSRGLSCRYLECTFLRCLAFLPCPGVSPSLTRVSASCVRFVCGDIPNGNEIRQRCKLARDECAIDDV